jgi:hypothetical protein
MDTQTVLDQAWAAINTLGGCPTTDYGRGWVDAIAHALEEIEKLGGRDPLERLAPKSLPPLAELRQ